MGLEGPADRATGQEQGDRAPDGTPFDLGDSRDLAAAVRAAWASEPLSVPRSAPEAATASAPTGLERDPLAHLRGEAQRRSVGPRFELPRIQRTTLLASLGVAAAVLAAAAFPLVSAGTPRPAVPIADERVRPTTSSTGRAPSTTAFTYPPETLAPSDTAPPPSVVAPPGPSAPSAEGPAPARAGSTATTSRPRTATTSRPASSPTTKAPAPTTTTTQAPPPPPDDGGSSDPDQPPPYP